MGEIVSWRYQHHLRYLQEKAVLTQNISFLSEKALLVTGVHVYNVSVAKGQCVLLMKQLTTKT